MAGEKLRDLIGVVETDDLSPTPSCNQNIVNSFSDDHVHIKLTARTVPVNMHVKSEVRSFNHFGAISI